jgi:alpha/beta superfamily hydrolase
MILSLSIFMNNLKNKKIVFIPGLGERAKDYVSFPKNIKIYNIDWNKIRLPRGKIDALIGFSMGAALACEYAEEHEIDTLVLCSLTPCIDTLEGLKAKEVIFILGEKEKWAHENNTRLAKTLKCKHRIIVIPKADHKIIENYKKKLIEIVNNT